eukprot:scaffold6705_cov134-Isochrysis_galbana.AAC.2
MQRLSKAAVVFDAKAIKRGHLSQAAGMPRPASCCDGGDGCRECGASSWGVLVSSAVLVVCCSVSIVCSCFISSVNVNRREGQNVRCGGGGQAARNQRDTRS